MIRSIEHEDPEYGALSLELWRTLSRAGPKATAESLSANDLCRMHVVTSLDDFIVAKVRAGMSLVLTGNAGDGKTHVLRNAKDVLLDANAEVVEDATALMRGGDVRPILDRWQRAISENRPFCLAINEYPLYQLRSSAPDFEPLVEVWRQCKTRLAYGDVDESTEAARGGVLVVDLSLRNPVTPAFFDAVLNSVLADRAVRRIVTADPDGILARNALRLTDDRVRGRLRRLLERLVALGARATVREIWILIARMLLSMDDGPDYRRSAWYFEALFAEDPRFDLTRLTRSVDPARCSHPKWDAFLEARTAELRAGWRFGEPPVPPHPVLDANDFAWLKRAFYFEHDCGEEALAFADQDAVEFRDLLTRPESLGARVSTVVNAINAAYCPVPFTGREHHLYLWAGHRFHEQPSRSFVAVERVGVDVLRLERPRLPMRLDGAFDYVPDHLMLVAPSYGGARLRIDYPLFKTLRRLGRGLPRKLVPQREVHRLDAFLEKLGAFRHGESTTVWSVHLENLQVIKVSLSADRGRFESVQLDA